MSSTTQSPKARPERPTTIKRGDMVRLLRPIWDGTQKREPGEEIPWPFADAPLHDVAVAVDDPTRGGHAARP